MKKIVFILLAVVLSCVVLLNPVAYAASNSNTASSSDPAPNSDCDGYFLGFRSWHNGITVTDNCIPSIPEDKTGDNIATFVWTIVLNVLFDIFVALGYLATGFIIYGGYLYIMSSGDPGKTAKAKKTLVSAVAGAAIALLSAVIVNTIITALGI